MVFSRPEAIWKWLPLPAVCLEFVAQKRHHVRAQHEAGQGETTNMVVIRSLQKWAMHFQMPELLLMSPWEFWSPCWLHPLYCPAAPRAHVENSVYRSAKWRRWNILHFFSLLTSVCMCVCVLRVRYFRRTKFNFFIYLNGTSVGE